MTRRPDFRPIPLPASGERSVYNALHCDPRMFFLGAPSEYQEAFPARLVRSVRHEAVGNRLVPTVVWRPEGVSAIRRIERVEMRDEERQTATIYQLSSVWAFDQTHGVQHEVGTQTPASWRLRMSRREGPAQTTAAESSTPVVQAGAESSTQVEEVVAEVSEQTRL